MLTFPFPGFLNSKFEEFDQKDEKIDHFNDLVLDWQLSEHDGKDQQKKNEKSVPDVRGQAVLLFMFFFVTFWQNNVLKFTHYYYFNKISLKIKTLLIDKIG